MVVLKTNKKTWGFARLGGLGRFGFGYAERQDFLVGSLIHSNHSVGFHGVFCVLKLSHWIYSPGPQDGK